MEKLQPFLVENFHPFSCLSNTKKWGRRDMIHLKISIFLETPWGQQAPSQFSVNNLTSNHFWRVLFMWSPQSGASFHSFNSCYLLPLLCVDSTSPLGRAAVSLVGHVGLVGLRQVRIFSSTKVCFISDWLATLWIFEFSLQHLWLYLQLPNL